MGSVLEKAPKDTGKRFLPSIVDERAQSRPDDVLISIPKSTNVIRDGLQDISYATMARAVNKCANWIEHTLEGKGQGFPTIATYLDPMDFRHAILMLAALKTGYKMFYSSPRNRPEVQVELLNELKCNVLFHTKEPSKEAKEVLERKTMHSHVLPALDDLLSDKPTKEHPYDKTWEEGRHDPYVVMHSSGTTGTPKVLVIKNSTIAAMDAHQKYPGFGEAPWYCQHWAGKRVATSFPWVHGGGILLFAAAIFVDFTVVIANDWPLPSVDANYLHEHCHVQSAWYSPSVLHDMVREQRYLENLKLLDTLAYAGGIMDRTIGDPIAERTGLFGIFAATEVGILPGEMCPPGEWQYYRYNRRFGHKFQHYAEDMYEIVLTRDPENEEFQGAFATLTDVQSFSMRDLYIEHPTKPGWWRSAGRVDDVVIFADAKKLNAVPYEAVIESHPKIRSAVICGSGRWRPAVLLQPYEWPKDRKEEASLLDEIWPTFEKANQAGPVFGRLIRDLVVLTQKEKPMARTGGKDTVQRKRTVDMYAEKLNEVYRAADAKGLTFGQAADQGKLL